MMRNCLVVALVFFACACAARPLFDSNVVYTAVFDAGKNSWSVRPGSDGAAWGKIELTQDQTGWNILHVSSNNNNAIDIQSFGAGYLEGAITQKMMWNAFMNGFAGTKVVISPKVRKFAADNWAWLQAMVAEHPQNEDLYWQEVGQTINQLNGLFKGYHSVAPASESISFDDFLLSQLSFELGDIMAATGANKDAPLKNASPIMDTTMHCSVLVKVSPDKQKLLASHDTWSGFNTMLRIYKHYELPFRSVATGNSFSSYPGLQYSGDDFYVLSTGLQIMETTNTIYNQSLYSATTTETVPYYIRVMVANAMSDSGADWMQYFGMYNSGTYNNQWQVVDYKLFSPGQPLLPGTLWIGEQIPGLFQVADQTASLQALGYFASYNIPLYKNVWTLSGYEAGCVVPNKNADPQQCSWHDCARANIFRRDQAEVKDMDGMKRIMRYNKWQTDPLSLKDACKGISARCDLNTPWSAPTLNGYSAFGGVDCKISNDQFIKKRTASIVAGPSWDDQPVFHWSGQWSGVWHVGQPELFNFHFIDQTPHPPKQQQQQGQVE